MKFLIVCILYVFTIETLTSTICKCIEIQNNKQNTLKINGQISEDLKK